MEKEKKGQGKENDVELVKVQSSEPSVGQATGGRARGTGVGRGRAGARRTRSTASGELFEEIANLVDNSVRNHWRLFWNRVCETFRQNQKELSDFIIDRWTTAGIYPDDLAIWLHDHGFPGLINVNGSESRHLMFQGEPAQGISQVLQGFIPCNDLQHYVTPHPMNFAETDNQCLNDNNEDLEYVNQDEQANPVPPALLHAGAIRPMEGVHCPKDDQIEDDSESPHSDSNQRDNELDDEFKAEHNAPIPPGLQDYAGAKLVGAETEDVTMGVVADLNLERGILVQSPSNTSFVTARTRSGTVEQQFRNEEKIDLELEDQEMILNEVTGEIEFLPRIKDVSNYSGYNKPAEPAQFSSSPMLDGDEVQRDEKEKFLSNLNLFPTSKKIESCGGEDKRKREGITSEGSSSELDESDRPIVKLVAKIPKKKVKPTMEEGENKSSKLPMSKSCHNVPHKSNKSGTDKINKDDLADNPFVVFEAKRQKFEKGKTVTIAGKPRATGRIGPPQVVPQKFLKDCREYFKNQKAKSGSNTKKGKEKKGPTKKAKPTGGSPVASPREKRFPRASTSSKSNEERRRLKPSQSDQEIKCTIEGCSRTFARPYARNRHMIEVHGMGKDNDDNNLKEFPFACDVSGCTKTFKRKSDMTAHKDNVHDSDKNFECTYCGKIFTTRKYLHDHERRRCKNNPSKESKPKNDESQD